MLHYNPRIAIHDSKQKNCWVKLQRFWWNCNWLNQTWDDERMIKWFSHFEFCFDFRYVLYIYILHCYYMLFFGDTQKTVPVLEVAASKDTTFSTELGCSMKSPDFMGWKRPNSTGCWWIIDSWHFAFPNFDIDILDNFSWHRTGDPKKVDPPKIDAW